MRIKTTDLIPCNAVFISPLTALSFLELLSVGFFVGLEKSNEFLREENFYQSAFRYFTEILSAAINAKRYVFGF